MQLNSSEIQKEMVNSGIVGGVEKYFIHCYILLDDPDCSNYLCLCLL